MNETNYNAVQLFVLWSVGEGSQATWCAHRIPYTAEVMGATELAEETRSFKYRATWKGLAGNTSMHGNLDAHRFQPVHAERYLSKVAGALGANRTSGKPWARFVRCELHCNSRKPNCDPPQHFNAKGESTRTTSFHFKTKEFILTRFSTLAILPH